MAKKKSKKSQLHVRVEPVLLAELEILRSRWGCSYSEVVRRAVSASVVSP